MELNPGLRRGRQALPPLHQSFSLDRIARIGMRGKKASKKLEGRDVQGKMVPLFTAHHRQKKWDASTKTFPLWFVYLYGVEQPLFSSLPLTAAPSPLPYSIAGQFQKFWHRGIPWKEFKHTGKWLVYMTKVDILPYPDSQYIPAWLG